MTARVCPLKCERVSCPTSTEAWVPVSSKAELHQTRLYYKAGSSGHWRMLLQINYPDDEWQNHLCCHFWMESQLFFNSGGVGTDECCYRSLQMTNDKTTCDPCLNAKWALTWGWGTCEVIWRANLYIYNMNRRPHNITFQIYWIWSSACGCLSRARPNYFAGLTWPVGWTSSTPDLTADVHVKSSNQITMMHLN